MSQLHDVVQNMRNETVFFLQQLIQIPTENPPGRYLEISEFLDTELSKLGFDVQLVKVPDELVTEQKITEPRINVIAIIRGSGSGGSVMFNAHLDTVPIGDESQWTYAPFSGLMADGRIYGRGATDSKGRIAAYVMAAMALKRLGCERHGDIIIAITCDEETGGTLGAGYVTQNGYVDADIAIVEGYSNQIIRAMAGVLHLRIISRGISAHSGWKWKGINAIENMCKVIDALVDLQTRFEHEPSEIDGMRFTSVNIGCIQGGIKTNVVPDHCQIDVEFRVIPEHSLDYVLTQVRTTVDELMAHDPNIDIEIVSNIDFNTPPTVVPENSPLVQDLQRVIEAVTGASVPVVGVLGQSDARWFIESGIPAINYGPGTSNNHVHHPDEFMEIEDLMQTIEVLASFAQQTVCKSIDKE